VPASNVRLEPSASITATELPILKAIFPFVPGNVPELAGSIMTADTITSTMADNVIDMAVNGRKMFSMFEKVGVEPVLELHYPPLAPTPDGNRRGS